MKSDNELVKFENLINQDDKSMKRRNSVNNNTFCLGKKCSDKGK